MNIWFTSDTHFGHGNIIRYCNRPWLRDGDLDVKGYWISKEIAIERTNEMDASIIKNWNERVKPDDLVYFLGDFCFKKSKEAPNTTNRFEDYRKQLNGNIIFIQGNHDRNNSCKTNIYNMTINYGGHKMILIHDSSKVTSNEYKIVLCGHVHNSWRFRRKSGDVVLVNLSVDVWNFRPVNISEIMYEKSKWHKEGEKELGS